MAKKKSKKQKAGFLLKALPGKKLEHKKRLATLLVIILFVASAAISFVTYDKFLDPKSDAEFIQRVEATNIR